MTPRRVSRYVKSRIRVRFAGRAALAAGLLCLSSIPGGAAAAAACHSTCAQELRACKRACAGGGQPRRDCRAACDERSNCTAPGAHIRTLAYVVTECTTDALGRSSVQQKLLIRRGNCDPALVMQADPSTPVPNSSGLCRNFGAMRLGLGFLASVAPF